MIVKKNLVLKSVSGGQEKGILSMQLDGESLSGSVRLYGFQTEPRGILSLGISSQQKVIKAGLTKQSNMLFSFFTQSQNMPEELSCAVVNFVGGEASPILFGSTKSAQQTFNELTFALQQSRSADEVEQVLDDFGVDYDDELKAEIEKEIDQEFSRGADEFKVLSAPESAPAVEDCQQCASCSDCVYKEYFYANQVSAQKTEEQDSPALQPPNEEKQFFKEIKMQVENLFSENKPEEFLQNAIPGSKWVRVDLDDVDYYVFGLIYQDDELKFVCYGVPGFYSSEPPKQLSGYPIWFPLDQQKAEGFGYWLTYQDAETGESVKAIME